MTGTWDPPSGWTRVTAIDAHTAGEPLRVITGGLPPIPGDTILEKRRYAREHLDHLRKALMWEPRGHADMYGCILTEPETGDGDVGVLFLHNEGYSTMCGHGIIGLVKVGLECGLFAPRDRSAIAIDTPAGRVTAAAEMHGDTVERVAFRNVPSFVLHRDAVVDVDNLGSVPCDLAYGGAFYAYVDAEPLGIALDPENLSRIVETGMAIKRAVSSQLEITHPAGEPDLDFLYGTILIGPGNDGTHSRNVCVFADGEVDRSPTGTGVSGRAAIHHARGELGESQAITIESIIGSTFDVAVVDETSVGGVAAVVPEVVGRAFITGRNELLIDPDDGIGEGFFLRT